VKTVEEILAGLSIDQERVLHKLITGKREKDIRRIITAKEYSSLNQFLKGYACGLYGVKDFIESPDFIRGKNWAETEKLIGI
jgi:hypothetical protein